MVEGTPEYSRQVLTKVVSVNRDHQMRLAQGLGAQCDKLVKEIRENNSDDELSVYSDDELLDFMILEFEQGKVPQSVEADSYIRQLTGIMLARNDLEQSARLAAKLHGLMVQLEQLERDAELKAKTSEYIQSCQQWNLDMALLATEQDTVARQLDSYTKNTLESGTRARMSFECRAKTVLRENQVEEVEKALQQITVAMKNKDGRMSRISQKGTGWGKSTIVQMLTDHACAQNIGASDRSVLVIAPESNQAELNITLGRYFAQKGLNFQVLDIENQYIKPARGKRWWTAKNLDQIYLTMMGMPPDCSNFSARVNNLRAPVGVSVKNIQILMQLRSQLQQQKKLSQQDRVSLQKLDRITDLVRESMIFLDEWDRTLMPPGASDLKEVADGVNRALKPLRVGALKPGEIMQCHGQLVQGCKRKHMLSATVGSGYTAAVAAGVTRAEEIKEQCHTDVFTTQQRFWHWLNCAKPVYVHLGQTEGREQLFRQVVDEVGTERQIIVFDGNRKDGNSAEQAVNDYKLLSEERLRKGGKSRGVLYYDENKQLHKYEKGDPVYGAGSGAPLPKEEEDFIKANRGRDVDVVLTHRESIGTDAPQGPESVGIYMGLLEQKEDGRTSLAAQQMGRLMRASGDLRKPQALYVVVNLDAVDELPGNEQEKDKFKAAYKEERDALEKVAEQFKCTVDKLTPELKELLNTPLQVPLQDDENPSEMERLTEEAMIDEVDRLAENKWPRNKMTFEQISALRSFKILQWQAKKAYLMLTAGELARREISPHTQSCEKVLHKANVESHLEEVFADENAWLKNGMGGQLSKCELSATGFDSDEVRDIVRRKIIVAVSDEISTIPRRASDADGDLGAVSKQISPGPVSQEITDRITRLKDEGIKTMPRQELDEPACDLVTTGGGKVPSIRQVLVSESSKSFEEALKRTDQVIKGFYFTKRGSSQKYKPIGIEQIVALRDELNRKARLVAQGKPSGVEEALKTRETIEKHYQELMRAISWVGFDGTMIGQGSECEEAYSRVCDLMRPVIDIPEKRRATAHGVGKIRWEPDDKFKGKEFEDSFLKKYSFKDAVETRLAEEKDKLGSKVNINTVYRLTWKEPSSTKHRSSDYSTVRAPLSDTTRVRQTAILNAQNLDKAVREAKNAKDRQHRNDEAMNLCQRAQGTNTELYEECMEEILQQLLVYYEQYSALAQEQSRLEQERIHQQSQLMQIPMIAVY